MKRFAWLIGLVFMASCSSGTVVVGVLNVSGPWAGNFTSSLSTLRIEFTAQFAQPTGDTTISGTYTITVDQEIVCFEGGTIDGTLSGNSVSLKFTDTTGAIVTFQGTVSNTVMRGVFSLDASTIDVLVVGCLNDSGTFVIRRR